MWQSAVAALFGLQIGKWVWVLAACALVVFAGWFAFSAHKARKRKRLRGRMLRSTLGYHPETVLVCLRSVQSDTNQVVQCVVQACRQASSPLRLRFAIVQEDTNEDVYVALEDIVRHSSALFNDIDLLAHVRTMSVIRSNYMHAAGAWKTMYDDETVVVCADAWVQWASAWDVTLVQTIAREARRAVLSAPNNGQFCALQRKEHVSWEGVVNSGSTYDAEATSFGAETVSWPAVVSRSFALDTAKVTDAVAVHHNFWAMHGAHFASLPVPTVHVPLYLVDVVLSDWLLTRGSSLLRTLPSGIFTRPPSSITTEDAHLSAQVPRNWDGRLHLSSQYLNYAGLARVNSRSSYAGGCKSEEGDESRESQDSDRSAFAPPSEFVVTVRAQLGLTPHASLSDEAVVKYGSWRAEQQQRLVLQAAAAAAAADADADAL